MNDRRTDALPEAMRNEPPSQHRNQELPQPKVVTSDKRARQGLLGLPVLAVLVGGLALAVIAWIVVTAALI